MKKRADGRYAKQVLVGYFPDGRRKMKTIYGKTIKEVEKKERELRNSIENGTFIEDNKITVGEWADEWLETFKTGISYNTRERYKSLISCQIKPLIGNLKLKDVKLNIIQRTINSLNQSLSYASVKKYKDALHQMFEQAKRLGYVANNPVEGVEMKKFAQKNRDALTDEEVIDICEFCKTNPRGAFIMTLLYTGMRRGEILALTKSDIDMENKIITINKAVEFIGNTPNVKPPKTPKSNRNIPILDPLLPYLEESIKNKPDNVPIFYNLDGSQFDKSSIHRFYNRFLQEYNCFLKEKYGNHEPVKFTMHQFRHTFCTILYKSGVDVKTSQEILGHSSVNVTLGIYTHIDESVRKINAEKVNQYIQKCQSVKS